jgi:translation elongation factor EF-Tu-like GTPase
MTTIRAKISLYDNKGRTWSIKSGYRPLFNFISDSKTSGQITVLNQEEIEVGCESEVLIKFISNSFLGNYFSIGTQFTFDEGGVALGEGEILEILA